MMAVAAFFTSPDPAIMRQPTRQRNIGIVVALGAGSGVIIAPMCLAGHLHSQYLDWITVTSFAIALAGVIYAICAAHTAKAYNQLKAGRGELARWTVEPAMWHAFVEADAKMSERYPDFPNEFKLTAKPHSDGVEVILGKYGIIMDGEYQMIPAMVDDQAFNQLEIIEGDHQSFINLHAKLAYYAKSGVLVQKKWTKTALRIPIPNSALPEAMAAVEWYAQRAKVTARKYDSHLEMYPLLERNIALVAVILGLAAGAFAFINRNHPGLRMQDLVTTAASLSVIVTPVAMGYAWVGHVLHQRKLQDRDDEC